jgi:hypothetical protein
MRAQARLRKSIEKTMNISQFDRGIMDVFLDELMLPVPVTLLWLN